MVLPILSKNRPIFVSRLKLISPIKNCILSKGDNSKKARPGNRSVIKLRLLLRIGVYSGQSNMKWNKSSSEPLLHISQTDVVWSFILCRTEFIDSVFVRANILSLVGWNSNNFFKHYREVDVICQATFTFSIGNFSVSHIFAKELLKSNHIYIRVKIMV